MSKKTVLSWLKDRSLKSVNRKPQAVQVRPLLNRIADTTWAPTSFSKSNVMWPWETVSCTMSAVLFMWTEKIVWFTSRRDFFPDVVVIAKVSDLCDTYRGHKLIEWSAAIILYLAHFIRTMEGGGSAENNGLFGPGLSFYQCLRKEAPCSFYPSHPLSSTFLCIDHTPNDCRSQILGKLFCQSPRKSRRALQLHKTQIAFD